MLYEVITSVNSGLKQRHNAIQSKRRSGETGYFMLNDLLQADSESVFSSEVCVVGAGAAGVALARDLANRNNFV